MKHLSEDHKQAISKGIAKAHKEKRHPGWYSANRKHKSYPEKLFEIIARTNGFFDKYEIIEQYPFHGYFFDFAIMDCMIDLEIDGSQHYRSAKNIKYDESRNNYVLSKGWRVYRIAAKELKDNPILEFNKLVEFIESEKQYRCYSKEDLVKYFNGKNQHKYGDRKAYSDGLKRKTLDKYLHTIQLLRESNIDFSKFGWVKHAQEIIGISNVKKWMKKYMPDFYEEKCFKRKVVGGSSPSAGTTKQQNECYNLTT